MSYDASTTALCMIMERRLDLSLIFDGIFEDSDPRMFGSKLIIEVAVVDLPTTLNGVHGSILVYNTAATEPSIPGPLPT